MDRGKVLSVFLCHCGGLLYPVEVFNELPKPLTLLFPHSLMEHVLLWQLWNFGTMSAVWVYVLGGTTLPTNPRCGKACIAAKKGFSRVNRNLRIVRKPENFSLGVVFQLRQLRPFCETLANRGCVFTGGSGGFVLPNRMTKLVLVTQPL